MYYNVHVHVYIHTCIDWYHLYSKSTVNVCTCTLYATHDQYRYTFVHVLGVLSTNICPNFSILNNHLLHPSHVHVPYNSLSPSLPSPLSLCPAVEPSASKSSSTKQTGHLYRPTSKFAKEEEEEEEETASPQPPSITPVTKKPPVRNNAH